MQDSAQFVQLARNCVTTWREPRRRRTEKKAIAWDTPCSRISQGRHDAQLKNYIGLDACGFTRHMLPNRDTGSTNAQLPFTFPFDAQSATTHQ